MSRCEQVNAGRAGWRLEWTVVLVAAVLLLWTSPAHAQRIVTGGAVDNGSLVQGDDLIQAIHDVQNPVSPFFGQNIHLVPPGGNPGTWYYTIRPAPIGDPRFDAGTGLPKIENTLVRIIGDPNTPQCQRRTVVIQAQQGQQLRLFFVRPNPSTPLPTALELQNVVLERGNLPDSGGAIYLDESDLTMTDCVARNNTSTAGRGGAIFATRKNEDVELLLTRTNFFTNAAAVSGGAVHAQMQTRVSGCMFTGNTVGGPAFNSGDGGAIYSSAFNLTVEPSPTCSGVGAPIVSQFENNEAAYGGAVYNNAQPQANGAGDRFRLFDQVRFRNNRARYTGGAVHNFQATGGGPALVFVRCRFGEIDGQNQAIAAMRNSAGSFGGAMFNNSTSSPFIVNSLFAGNAVSNVQYPLAAEPSGRGGAIASLLSCRPIIRQCEFIDNTALVDGGAISSQSDGCRTTIDDCVFLRNRAGAAGSPGGDGGRGGGVFTGGSSVSFLHNCAFARNTAAQGGAMANDNNGSCLVLHCTLSSSQRGGGVHNTGTSTTDGIGRRFVNSIIWGNRLTGAGNPATDVASFSGSGGSLMVDFSDLDNPAAGHPAIGGTGNINCDPLHVDPVLGNLHLTQCSPCIDRGSEALRLSVFATTTALDTTTLSGGLLPLSLQALVPDFVPSNDYDDNGTEPDNLSYSDLIDPRPVTPRVQQCEVDMGADESLFFHWATMTLACQQRSDPEQNDLQDCTMLTGLVANLTCEYCAGDDVIIAPNVVSNCPGEFRVVQWWRLPPLSQCPPPDPENPTGTQVMTGGRFTILADGRLCINGALPADAGCYYAILERRDCLGTQRAKFKNCNPTLDPEGCPFCDAEECCIQRIAACACITIYDAPSFNDQPDNAAVCVDGSQTICASFLVPPTCTTPIIRWYKVAGGPGDLDDTLLGTCTVGVMPPCMDANAGDGITINLSAFPGVEGKWTSCLTFTPATLTHAGMYYAVIDCGSALCNARSINATLAVYRQPVITLQPEARTTCVNGMQQLCLTVNSPDGRPLQIDWFRLSSCSEPIPENPDSPNRVCTSACLPAMAGVPTQYCCTVTAPALPGSYFYKAVVRICDPNVPLKCPAVVSNCVTLTVVDPRPCVESRVVCVGGTQCLSVNTAALPGLPGGYTYTFRWFHLGAADCTFPTCLTCTQNPGAHGAACAGGNIVNNGGAYSGATTSTLRITNAQLANRGRYYVQIGLDGPDAGTDPDLDKCMANSNCACLIVVNPQPVVNAATVCEGGTQYLELVSPLPTPPCDYSYVYQWFFRGTSECTLTTGCPTGTCTGGNALMNNARYDGVTTDRLCIMGATPTEQGCYYVRVTISGPNTCNPAGTTCQINSNCACLDVIPQPTIAVDPEDAYVCEGNEQCFTATVAYSGTATLCWEWHRKTTCAATTSTIVDQGTWTVGQPLTFTYCVTPIPPDAADRCYFFRVRVCNPDDLDKCPAVDSDCACLDVLPPLDPCELECASNMTDAQGNCLFCDRAQIALCCNVPGTTQPLCYQWYYSPTPCDPNLNPGCVTPIPGANSQCFEFEFNADGTNMPCGPGCYYVKINYAALSDPDCDGLEGKCDAVYSAPLCIAETTECCPRECDCKDNADPNQEFYALWRTGTWDGSNGEDSFERVADGVIVKAADDIYLCPSSMHNIRQFLAEMLVKRENLLIEPMARLRFYEDCNGTPGELIAEFESEECPAFLGSTPENFHRFQFYFDLSEDCFWLRGGIYWVSVVGIAPSQDTEYHAVWVTAGLPSGGGLRPECGLPPIGACCIGGVCSVQTQNDCVAMTGQWYRGAPCTDSTCGTSGGTILGKRPQTMIGADPWMEYDPCCHPCDDFVFCVSGVSCPIMWDNGKPYLGGADGPNPPAPPIDVFGTRSEKSVLIPRDSRAADQFVIKTCDGPEEVCYLEGYIFTNCPSFEVHLEIYYNNCDQPDFVLPGGVPFYHTINVEKQDLGIDGLRVGATNVRAYKVYVCDFGDEPLIFQPGQNYWISFSVRDSFSVNERAFFAHVRQPCEPCTDPSVWKINPGMELAPGRQIPDWRSVNADFAFLIATKKRIDDTLAAGTDPEACIADANSDGAVAVDDIFYFLASYFAGCP